jgi:SAM-dependent methyltransferase
MKIKTVPLYVAMHLLLVWSNPLVAQQPGSGDVDPDIIYVPTPYKVVEAMLEVADIGPTDILYDLGSGDGRIVIFAARDYGATGIGVEIDPKYIDMARLIAVDQNVTDKVTFIQANLFDIDFTDATVVTLYLSEELNLRLRQTLLEDLKPGTRIISHEFTLGDWEPERSLNINGHMVHYWVVP